MTYTVSSGTLNPSIPYHTGVGCLVGRHDRSCVSSFNMWRLTDGRELSQLHGDVLVIAIDLRQVHKRRQLIYLLSWTCIQKHWSSSEIEHLTHAVLGAGRCPANDCMNVTQALSDTWSYIEE